MVVTLSDGGYAIIRDKFSEIIDKDKKSIKVKRATILYCFAMGLLYKKSNKFYITPKGKYIAYNPPLKQ